MDHRIHITSAIAYSNGPPHIGHAYEMLATDTFARFQRRKLGAANVTFVTGTDEHGDKNKRAAEAAGLTPKAFVDKISAMFAQHGPRSTSATTTLCAPPTLRIRRWCRRCSSAASIAATSTSRTTKVSTASDASASTPRKNSYPVTSVRCITLPSSGSRRAITS